MDLDFLLMFVDTSKVAGWTRAAVGAGLVALLSRWPWLSQYLDQSTQTALAVAASGLAVGVWSHIAKVIQAKSQQQVAAPQNRGPVR